MTQFRILTELDDPRWEQRVEGVEDLFCPFMRGLPREHATLLALLPIHDANGVLLAAVEAADHWPAHGWACIFPSDPFRTQSSLLAALRQRDVSRICCYPGPALFGSAMATTLDMFGLGAKAVDQIAAIAASLGMELATFSQDDILTLEHA